MQEKTATALNTDFAQEVREGLTDYPKHLSSKYFYDEVGDKLFQDIMAMPEYYLTDSEFNILETHKEGISKLFMGNGGAFSLFELGAGDGKKTKILLRNLVEKEADFDYRPIDISQNALNQLEASVSFEIPEVRINTIQGTYFETLADIAKQNGRRKVILFLGSNIGNLLHPQAVEFLKNIRDILNEDDLVFMGFDQKKHPQKILDAYNDKTGITEAFNKNLLARINKELGGNFELDNFLHWEVYDPETGTAKSYLVAKKAQKVFIEALGLKVNFKQWETIHTEISQKYDDEVVNWLADKAGLDIIAQFSDGQSEYRDYVFKKSQR
ncbi:L-histidine N(alpha)-methyltransferase [Allomuricauda sp. SCSIO 65647]|uniref:L-histidine N(alpha)-methyltransferase n=1 Tax=Allomuricauda sp. SCSIO 65647 TaxID=2908843 RepID=UPI001F3C288F|nr:L-histidine N(alpha)-methyltransferase [Muricauda sp. SCSIO 65647]UJH68280.1 L-histidine N(alpha)-methyltransferase [Muricauda sp. SCSIO 65647]